MPGPQKPPSLAQGLYVCVADGEGEAHVGPSARQLAFPLAFTCRLHRLQSKPEEGTWGFSVFHGLVHGLLESQEYVRTSQSSVSQNLSFPNLSSLDFGCFAFVPTVFYCCRQERLKHLPVIVFHKTG